jgi:hypothetical protein
VPAKAISKLSGLQIRGLEKFHFLYGDSSELSSERVILKILRQKKVLVTKISGYFRICAPYNQHQTKAHFQ